ncbi:hypothetical protein [uncultured Paracoccus sp.]|uniref:hypothetical protein n=1 Tax=uncultured Paracoccus sp. TaxID=189685 RepID=UPI002606BC8F|nr:hypothetical protein [uncultured Paracoccus sp.]
MITISKGMKKRNILIFAPVQPTITPECPSPPQGGTDGQTTKRKEIALHQPRHHRAGFCAMDHRINAQREVQIA